VKAAFRPGPDTGVTVGDDQQAVYVAHLPAGPLVVLEGPAALIWLEATSAPATGWVSRVAEAFGQPEDAIADDVDAFVRDLCGRALLEATPGDPEPDN